MYNRGHRGTAEFLCVYSLSALLSCVLAEKMRPRRTFKGSLLLLTMVVFVMSTIVWLPPLMFGDCGGCGDEGDESDHDDLYEISLPQTEDDFEIDQDELKECDETPIMDLSPFPLPIKVDYIEENAITVPPETISSTSLTANEILTNVATLQQGAEILVHPTIYVAESLNFKFFGLSFPWLTVEFASEPRVLLHEDSRVFRFVGDQGIFVVRLSDEFLVRALALEHSDFKSPESQPRHVALKCASTPDNWTELGNFTFPARKNDSNARTHQTFFVKTPISCRSVKIHVVSNWGNPEFTSISSVAILV